MQPAATNRTFICSVVFLDIVEYSKKPVAEQIVFKERLNTLLTAALVDISPNDRIILDTGDGAALSFLGDPEEALFVSLTLRDALVAAQPIGPQMKMRVGINLGPVKLIKDINGQPNIIGDGINVAQRIMSFAQPGQILSSRSYYEVASRIADDYGQLFHYEGSRTDKHVREHEVYEVQATAALPDRPSRRARATSPSQTAPVFDKLAQSASVVSLNFKRRPRIGAVVAAAAIIAVAIGIRMHRAPTPPTAAVSSPPSKVADATPQKAAAAPPSKTEVQPKGVAAPPKAVEIPPKASAKEQPPTAQTARKNATAPQAAAKAETQPEAAGGTGMLLFTVSPWGEIYVDGRHYGTTPPLYELRIPSGQHRIEIRHSDYPTHVRTVNVRPGTRLDVKHWFVAAEQPNPFNRLWK